MDSGVTALLSFVDSGADHTQIGFSSATVETCMEQLDGPWINNSLAFVVPDSFSLTHEEEYSVFEKLGKMLKERKPKYFK